MKKLILISSLFSIYTLAAQYTDHFLDGDFSNNPSWQGTYNTIIVNSNHQLQIQDLNQTQNPEQSFLATTSTLSHNTSWQVDLQILCSADTGTYARFYIISDNPNLKSNLNGYYIQAGGAKNTISLNKQQGRIISSMIAGPDFWLDMTSNTISILCTRTTDGTWQLLAKRATDSNFTLLGQSTDATTSTSTHSGILWSYTDMSNTALTADNFIVKSLSTPPVTNHSSRHAIIFTELMIDPSPSISLPEVEYVEIYNRTESAIDLTNWKLLKSTIKSGTIQPQGYAILCSESSAPLLAPYGNTIVVTSFPALTNTAKLLYLTDTEGNIITWIDYKDSWFQDDHLKKDGGWALERIDIDNLNCNQENWKLSCNNSGGTPGLPNACAEHLPDNTPPHIHYAYFIDDTINIVFNKEMTLPKFSEDISLQSGNTIEKITFSNPQHNTLSLQLASILLSDETDAIELKHLSCISSLSLIDTTLIIALPEEATPNDLVINEILFNPTDQSSKFIEIYNRSQRFINLRNLTISRWLNNELTSPQRITSLPIVLSPEQYLLISPNLKKIHNSYTTPTYGIHLECSLPPTPISEGNIVLSHPSGEVIDQLFYNADMHHPLLTNLKGVSLERVHPDAPTQQPGNWQSAASTVGYATPGYKNSQYLEDASANSAKHFSLSNDVLSPNNDGYNDITTIHYQLPADGYLITIQIYTPSANLVTTLCNNMLAGTEGDIVWNGTAKDKTMPVGIYILYIQATHPTQKTLTEKLICVISSP